MIPIRRNWCIGMAGAISTVGIYTGQVGLVYIEPKDNPGAHDREIFLVLKEFAPFFSRGGDMAVGALAGDPVAELQRLGKGADAVATQGTKGFEVGYRSFTINGPFNKVAYKLVLPDRAPSGKQARPVQASPRL